MSALPGVNRAELEEAPAFQAGHVAGAFWQIDFRDRFPIAPDSIRNHDQPMFLGVLDGSESVSDWNPWEGRTGPHPWSVLRFTPGGDDATTLQVFAQAAPLAIDCWDRHPDHGQVLASGQGFAAGEIPLMDIPQSLPYHYDYGDQVDMGAAISPRQVFRQPPSISDQTAAVYAAGF